MASVGTRAYVFGGVAGGENMQCYGDMFCIDCKGATLNKSRDHT
jgi:hypothetical protein